MKQGRSSWRACYGGKVDAANAAVVEVCQVEHVATGIERDTIDVAEECLDGWATVANSLDI